MNDALRQGITAPRLGPTFVFIRTLAWRRIAVVLALSALVAGILVTTDGNMMAAGAAIALIAILAITWYRVDWGFLIFFFFVLVFDQFVIPGFDPLTTRVGYFLNINAIGYLPSIEQGVVNPLELQLLLLLVIWVGTGIIRGKLQTFKVPLKGPMILLYVAIIGSMGYGLARSGDLIISLWETRALFYLAAMVLFVPQIIQTETQVKAVLWTAIAGISVKAFQGAARYASLGFSFGHWPDIYETLTNHEDPVFIVTLFLFLMALILFGDKGKQRKALLFLVIPLLLGYVAGQRRAAYASFMASVVAFIVLLPAKQRKTVLKIIAIFGVFFAMYLGVFWESYSRLGSVAQQFKATITEEGSIRGEKDIKSTLYRKIENYNLGRTFQEAPLVGVSFGRRYDKVMTLWGSSFALGDYVAHNQILWLFVQMGVIGAFLFWLFFNTYVFRSAFVFASLTDPYFKAVCAICIIAVINQMVVSYVDMQLTYYRNMVYLGVLMGLVPVLGRLDEEKRAREIETPPPSTEGG
jgi:hypothetical protein